MSIKPAENVKLQEQEIMEAATEWKDKHELASDTRFSVDSMQDKLPDLVEKGMLVVDTEPKKYRYRTASKYLPLVYDMDE